MKAHEFQPHLKAFGEYNQSKGLSPRTVESYHLRLRRFERWLIETHGPETEVTTRRIREYAAMRLGNGKKPATVRAQLEALRVFYGFLVEDEVIAPDDNPMNKVKCIKARPPEIEPLTLEQVHAFFETFNLSRPTGHRNYTLCLLILDTGLRAGEAVALRLEDVDTENSSIRVKGKGGKARTAFIGQRMKAELARYLEQTWPSIANGGGVLFPLAGKGAKHTAMTSHYLSNIVREKMDEVGVRPANSTTHRLRHTFAILFLRNGGDAFSLQRLLGHADLEMTKRYVNLAREDLQAAHRKAGPLDNLELWSCCLPDKRVRFRNERGRVKSPPFSLF